MATPRYKIPDTKEKRIKEVEDNLALADEKYDNAVNIACGAFGDLVKVNQVKECMKSAQDNLKIIAKNLGNRDTEMTDELKDRVVGALHSFRVCVYYRSGEVTLGPRIGKTIK